MKPKGIGVFDAAIAIKWINRGYEALGVAKGVNCWRSTPHRALIKLLANLSIRISGGVRFWIQPGFIAAGNFLVNIGIFESGELKHDISEEGGIVWTVCIVTSDKVGNEIVQLGRLIDTWEFERWGLRGGPFFILGMDGHGVGCCCCGCVEGNIVGA